METMISNLEDEKAGLEKEVSDLKRACEMIEKRAAEQKGEITQIETINVDVFQTMHSWAILP